MNVLKGRGREKVRIRHYTIITVNADYPKLVASNTFEYKKPLHLTSYSCTSTH
jgi:hypothetical protein